MHHVRFNGHLFSYVVANAFTKLCVCKISRTFLYIDCYFAAGTHNYNRSDSNGNSIRDV